MKLIIDISEEDYDMLINYNNDKLPAVIARTNLWEALKNGTPFEKHDEEVIKKTVESIWGKPPYTELLDEIQAEIEQIPSELTADGRRMIRRGSVFRIIEKYRQGDKE